MTNALHSGGGGLVFGGLHSGFYGVAFGLLNRKIKHKIKKVLYSISLSPAKVWERPHHIVASRSSYLTAWVEMLCQIVLIPIRDDT